MNLYPKAIMMKVLSRLLCLVLCLPLLVIGQEKITWNKDGAEMALILAGSFEMGDSKNEPDDWMKKSKPVHRVELDAFYMDVHEVTVRQFKTFVNETGYSYNRWNDVAKYSPGDDYPIVLVDWHDAMAYAKWTGKRLPTEAEWEYAARGGLIGKRYPWGDDENVARDRANYSGTGGKDKWERQTSPVGSFEANGYGLYDMAGNVYEWCADWYGSDYYSASPAKNPLGPDTGSGRLLRGGSWDGDAYGLRVDVRYYDPPINRFNYIGFRCVSGLDTSSDSFTNVEPKPLYSPLPTASPSLSRLFQRMVCLPGKLSTPSNSKTIPS